MNAPMTMNLEDATLTPGTPLPLKPQDYPALITTVGPLACSDNGALSNLTVRDWRGGGATGPIPNAQP